MTYRLDVNLFFNLSVFFFQKYVDTHDTKFFEALKMVTITHVSFKKR